MVKGEVNHRQKATMEQSDQKGDGADSCSQAEAEVALFDHDNNVEGAVLAVFDRPEKDNMWKETKGRKSKKLETNEKDDYYGNRRGDSSKANRGRNPSYQSREDGPLVFEQSVAAAPVPLAQTLAANPLPLAKKSTSHVSSSKSVESQHKPEQIKEATSPSVREYTSSITEQNEPSPASMISTSVPSTSFGPSVATTLASVLHSTPAAPINSLETTAVLQVRSPVSSSVLDTSSNSIPATQSNSLLHDVEFISGDGPSMLDFQFGFHPDAQPVVDNMLTDRQQQQQQQLIKGREAANNALSYMNTCSLEYQSNDLRGNNNGSGLSQKTGSQQQQPLNPSVSLQQQQQPSAQQQHNSLQQQQQQMYAAAAAQFPGYGIPYLYSPVASNMRDVDQLNNERHVATLSHPSSQCYELPEPSPVSDGFVTAPWRAPVDNNNKFQQGNVSSTNGLQSNNSYSQLGSQSGHQLRNQGGMDNGAAAAGPNAVAPPPGFSGPPFLTQPSFQSLFQLPSYTHPQLTMPYFLQGNTQQRQPQSQHAPQPASLQQQPHHQRPAEHASYLDMNKYPQQASITTTTNSNNMLPQSGNSYQSLSSGPLQSGHQQRNQQGVAGAGGLDNMQYYQPSKWSGGNGGGWRA
uniref:GBF-interacting protein 1 N-terminal domain-containing protein n=1 Tax=Ditylenchus dipsaci TaxID=166011 RepID=A0A915E860_9BILA